ncbi:MAG: glycosyltransferase family 39 protein [Planctomycetota bacterium]
MRRSLHFALSDARPWLLVALALYVALRVAILLTNFDAVAMPNYELGTIGNLAKVIAEADGGAPHAMHFDNVGGHLVVGWLAAPLYAAIGDRYVVLKLVPLFLGVGTLLWIWRLCRRHFDTRAAIIAVLLFAVAPPTLCKYSLIAKGNHFENLFFQLWFLNAFFDAHAGDVTRRRLLAIGFVAGLTLFVYTGALLLVATAVLLHVYLRGARASLRDLAFVLPAFAVGIAPLVWLDLASAGRERNFLAVRFVENGADGLRELAGRFVSFWTEVLPASPCFENAVGMRGAAVGWIFLACFAAAWISAVVVARRASSKLERAKLVPFVAHLPLFALLVAAFDFPFKPYGPPIEVGQYRYLVPHFAFAAILIGVVSARALAASSLALRACGGTLALLSLATGLFTLPIVRPNAPRWNDGWHYDGYWFEYYANVILRDDPWTPARIESFVRDFDPVNRGRACAGVGFYLAWRDDAGLHGHAPQAVLDADLIVAGFAPELTIDVAHGIGTYLRRLVNEPGGGERLQRVLSQLDASNAAVAPYCAEGLALDLRYPLVASVHEFLQRGLALREHVPARWQRGLHRGLGIACGRLLPRGLDDAAVAATRSALDPAFREAFEFGLGWGCAESTQRANRCAALRRMVTFEGRAAAWQGFGAALRHNLGPGPHDPSLEITSDERAWLERGASWPNYPLVTE